ncbi:TPA: helix-turn-helix transcriptional regulator [Salmonella enterica]|uniref:Helix-turn-helix transcriptional regulator n=1 Tax=Salmonella enterica TaxID=28901 RepID=A0A759MMK8_SALER|nr:XRE family transcriptional regulator [Salmonella enterica subsp. enterica serovar Richmond]HAG1980921.1 helix-turn-helix transcriptional regulator [Salmonella enterica]HAK8370181.1 helix-turn-helix transcriptional regulator [Salmonella enterica]HAK8522386.1 helix-turn-helix transcriptional regulator [Salmonella enterica]
MKKTPSCFRVAQGEPENEFPSQIGSRCRLRRSEMKLSRSKVAEMIGVSLSTLQAWENQEREPTASDILKLASVLRVDVSWLLTGQATIKTKDTNTNKDVDSHNESLLNEMLSILRRTNSHDKEVLINSFYDIGIKGILSKLQQPDDQRSQPEREYTREEQEAMIMALPVRESLKTAFARGVAAGEAADREILRILESHERGVSPGSVSDATETPDPSLKQKAG